jgi:hypothetical protein
MRNENGIFQFPAFNLPSSVLNPSPENAAPIQTQDVTQDPAYHPGEDPGHYPVEDDTSALANALARDSAKGLA